MREIVFISRKIAAAGGIQRQILCLAKSLYERKVFRPVLICSNSEGGFAEAFRDCGFEVFEVAMSAVNIFSAAKRIERILEGRDIAVMQTHMFRESLIARLVCRKRKDIKHILRAQTYIDCSSNKAITKYLYHIIDRVSSRYVDVYIANGAYLKDEIVDRSGVCAFKVEVVLNGRDSIGEPDGLALEPSEPFEAVVAMVANFVMGKGHDTLCRALGVLNRDGIKIKARLIGSEVLGNASSRDYVMQVAGETATINNLEFYGSTDDVYSAMKDVAVVVLPSDSEGVPNCLLEAMSLRKLVVASRTGGVDEIVEDKKTGLLCEPKDAAGLADLLRYVFTNPAAGFEEMRSAGLERWRQDFTGEKMVDKFVEIYQRIGLL